MAAARAAEAVARAAEAVASPQAGRVTSKPRCETALGEPLGFPQGHRTQGSPRLGFCTDLKITECKSAQSQGSSWPNLLGNLIWGAHGSSTPFLRGLQSPGGGSEHFWVPLAALVLCCPSAEPRGEVVAADESPQTQSSLKRRAGKSPNSAGLWPWGGLVEVFW